MSEIKALNFGLIGASGYIAPRHLKAIKETGNNLVAALDKFDSVGIMDSYFPKSDFFVEFERFDRHFDKLKRQGTKVDYVSICTPNYLHDSHIGIHFFDMLSWVFGEPQESVVHLSEPERSAGFLRLKKARVRWFLSVDYNDIPEAIKQKGQRTFRSITMEGEEIEFSEGFTDLHTESYRQIIAGNGFGLADAKASIQMAYGIRNFKPAGLAGDYHPFCKK